MWIFAKGKCRKAQESVRRARGGHFGYILTVQLSQAVSQVLSHSLRPSGHFLLWFWKSQVWNFPFAQGESFLQINAAESEILPQGDNIHPSINVTDQKQLQITNKHNIYPKNSQTP